MPIKETKKISVGVRLIFKAVREKRYVLKERLADVLLDTIYSKGIVVDKKKSIFRLLVIIGIWWKNIVKK